MGLIRDWLTQRTLDLNDSSLFILQMRTLRPEKQYAMSEGSEQSGS